MTTAAEAEERVANLIILCDRLGAMLAQETQAFEAHRPMDVRGEQPETQRLANLYRHEAARIRANPGLVSPASPASRRKLLDVVRAFETVLARHGHAVTAAKTISEGLVQAMAAEIASQRSSVSPYGPTARSGKGSATAITLNRRA